MTAERPTLDAGGSVLVLRIEGGHGEPFRLLRISRPVDGRVLVHEWPVVGEVPLDAAKGADLLRMRETDAEELLASIERAHRERRGISESMFLVRAWLRGTSS